MSERTLNIQDAFLNYTRKNKVPVTIFLLNGVKITGNIICFDQNVVVVKKEQHTQLIYKHAISTFYPHGSLAIFEWNAGFNNFKKNSHKNTKSIQESDDLSLEDYDDFEEDDDELEEI